MMTNEKDNNNNNNSPLYKTLECSAHVLLIPHPHIGSRCAFHSQLQYLQLLSRWLSSCYRASLPLFMRTRVPRNSHPIPLKKTLSLSLMVRHVEILTGYPPCIMIKTTLRFDQKLFPWENNCWVIEPKLPSLELF